jgi:hypothetical protein
VCDDVQSLKGVSGDVIILEEAAVRHAVIQNQPLPDSSFLAVSVLRPGARQRGRGATPEHATVGPPLYINHFGFRLG